jgi:hypothetical protein
MVTRLLFDKKFESKVQHADQLRGGPLQYSAATNGPPTRLAAA